MMKIITRKKFILVLVIIWMGVIFSLSHQHSEDSSELSSGISALLVTILTNVFQLTVNSEIFHFVIRKGAHFTAYFILGFLLIHALQIGKGERIYSKTITFSFVIAVLYAISDEVHQLFIPGRSGEIRDVLIDSCGALTGIGFYIFLFNLIIKHRMKKRETNRDIHTNL